MSQQLPAELESRCEEILNLEKQGVPLTRVDYLLFGLVTVIVPAILIAIGASL
jgi:predicted nucleic acid-binding Zn ribbon protein